MAFNWNRLFCFVIHLSLVMSLNVSDDAPITYAVLYSNFKHFSQGWGEVEYRDYSKSYAVVDYSHYANNFDEFREKYPFLTIETTGKAESESTFGNPGRGKFGTLTFDTRKFDSSEYHNEILVVAHDSKLSSYGVRVEIGIGFKKNDNELYLRPFIHGYFYSWFYSFMVELKEL
ncbi:uncharacterized protein LOC116344682 [Contarinia nasturtii]|uniref:uncharacterized protein LOC116344682 n=1 Tax=Contarinia nasturtii TaxID=265458 RepID=UPI0012D3B676|nr:uncharacterized protein LOC116344682 [Contarinia nasturtii]